MSLKPAFRWVKLAILVLEVVLRLLRSLPRLRKEANEAIDAAGLAYFAAWEALADRDLSRDEVKQAREKLEALGREVEDVLQALAEVVGLKEGR